jgi:putative transposase
VARKDRSLFARVEKVRLYPSPDQIRVLEIILAACCDLYNAGLQERRGAYDHWKIAKPKEFAWPTLSSQQKQFVELRAEHDWIGAVYAESMRDALKKLDNAFAAFFRRHAKGENPGYPRFRAKRRYDTFSYPHGDRAVKVFEKTLRLPDVGFVKYRRSGRALPETFGVVKITRACGKWYACFEHVIEQRLLKPTGKEVGVDVGIANYAATSDGKFFENPKFSARAKKNVDRLYQAVARCKRRSKRRSKAVSLLALAKARETRQRVDHAHKFSRALVNCYDLIAFEDLRVLNMVRSAKGTIDDPGINVAQKAGLNRSIQDAGWRRAMNFTSYKAAEAGKYVVFVDPRNTSRTCPICRHVSSENRKTQAVFLCANCGHADHANTNAGVEILTRARLGLASAA